MKIALIGPSKHNVQLETGNYLQEYIYNLVSELVDKGYEVTYFGMFGSKLPCEVFTLNLNSIDWSYEQNISENLKSYAEEQHAYFEVFKYIEETGFHIVQNLSNHQIPIFTAQFLKIPTVTTLLEPPKGLMQSTVKLNQHPNNFYVTLNHELANTWMGHSNIHEVISRGILQDQLIFNPENSNNTILYFGDISPYNALGKIIKSAKKSGFLLKIYGAIKDDHYFKSIVETELNSKIAYEGEVEHSLYKQQFHQAALSVFAPDQLEDFEPFVLESLACGTPTVIISEEAHLINLPDCCVSRTNSKTPDNLRQVFIETLKKSRKECRDYVQENFNYKKMADEYISFYQKLLS